MMVLGTSPIEVNPEKVPRRIPRAIDGGAHVHSSGLLRAENVLCVHPAISIVRPPVGSRIFVGPVLFSPGHAASAGYRGCGPSTIDRAGFRNIAERNKLQTLLDHDGYLPAFAAVSPAQAPDIKKARSQPPAQGLHRGGRPGLHQLRLLRPTHHPENLFRHPPEA
jgi:hypothetical protein